MNFSIFYTIVGNTFESLGWEAEYINTNGHFYKSFCNCEHKYGEMTLQIIASVFIFANTNFLWHNVLYTNETV